MKFIRLTSVFLCCALLSSFLILPASAADDDNYYSGPAVSDGSVLVAPASLGGVMLSSATSWDTNDRAVLQGIYKFIQYMTTAPSSYSDGSVIGLLHRILNKSGSSNSVPNADTNFRLYRNGTGTNGLLFDIFTKIGDVLPQGYGTSALSWLSTISSNVMNLASESTLSAISDKLATEKSLSRFYNSLFSESIVPLYSQNSSTPDYTQPFFDTWGFFMSSFLYNNDTFWNSGLPSIYKMLYGMYDVLANEQDKAIRDSQKDNVDQVSKDFVNGSSGKTSLGKDDFGSLSSVGGTFKDTISLNGQSSIADLTTGLSDANTAGQGWFSQATKDSLDAVSGSGSSESTVSTFSDDGLTSVDVDPDPYHMQGFEVNYAWLWGDD